MKFRNLLSGIFAGLALTTVASAYADTKPDVEVLLFTDRANPFVDDGGYPVIYLDEVLRIEDQLTQAISHFDLSENMDPRELEAVKAQLAQVMDEQALLDAYAGLSLAWSLNITHIPAIVSRAAGNTGMITYGEYDVPYSMEKIRQ